MHSSYDLIWFIGSNSHLFFHLCIDDDFEVPTSGHIHSVIRSASLYILVENIILLSVWIRRNGWLNFQPNWKVHTEYLENHSQKPIFNEIQQHGWCVEGFMGKFKLCVNVFGANDGAILRMLLLICLLICPYDHMNFDFIWAFRFVKTYASVAPAFDRPNEIINKNYAYIGFSKAEREPERQRTRGKGTNARYFV